MVSLLSDAQREELPLVILRRERFKQLVAKAILNRGTTFSNGINTVFNLICTILILFPD